MYSLNNQTSVVNLLLPMIKNHVAIKIGERNGYNPIDREVTLTYEVYSGKDSKSIAIAAHELGHAQQFPMLLFVPPLKAIMWLYALANIIMWVMDYKSSSTAFASVGL